MKYLRPVLYTVSWGILVSIFFISSNISYAYLGETMVAGFFFAIYRTMFILMLPMVFIWFIFLLITIFKDNEVKKMLERGVDVQSSI